MIKTKKILPFGRSLLFSVKKGKKDILVHSGMKLNVKHLLVFLQRSVITMHI